MYSQINANKRRSYLLIILFISFALALGWIFGQIYSTGFTGIVFALTISLFMALISYYSGDKIALATSGAKPITKQDNPYVYRLVENLTIATGLPLPKIYIINDPAPNAFATGRDPAHSSIALTTGLIDRLENEELEGVIAHELSHIKNYDIRVMTIVIVLVGTIALLADILIRGTLYSRSDRSKGNAGLILLAVGLALAILSPIIAKVIQFAVSRRREYLADASGALITRYPDGLANALHKISSYKQPLKKASNATAHLYISNPFGEKAGRFFHKIFSTHPPIKDRIKKLREMGN